jgi:Flp pilus assembly protein TadG
MTRQASDASGEQGFALVYMAAVMTGLLVFTGLAVDTGRAYVVKAQLSKAVDGAALAAARSINSGNPRDEAVRIFRANFPTGFLGTTSGDPTAAADFFSSAVNAATGVNVVTVNATAVLPTTFMKVANFDTMTVTSSGEATRRMVDLSLVLDVSGSIGPQWGAVRDAARSFINSFDQANDRMALVTFGNGASVLDQMPSSRGFNKTKVWNDVPNNLPGGSTNMVEGLYRAWDEMRRVPAGAQSGLRVIVLFTDGCSNSVPGIYDAAGVGKAMRTFDFPQVPGDTNGQTWMNPQITGFYDAESGATVPTPGFGIPVIWNSTTVPAALPAAAKTLPATSTHTHHYSSGIPTTFPLQTNLLTVDGVPQDATRGLRDFDAATGKYPSQIWNVNNAARNLIEIISNEVRKDTSGDYKIRIYTIGMGQLVRLNLGTRGETAESILMRIANDAKSVLDRNANQLEGKYFYAQTAADVGPAFQGIQNQIIRLTQ